VYKLPLTVDTTSEFVEAWVADGRQKPLNANGRTTVSRVSDFSSYQDTITVEFMLDGEKQLVIFPAPKLTDAI
jgi:hypothetical protein